jgi:hypothetical protein
MNRHQQTCAHCRAKAGLEAGPVADIEPIDVPDLPDEPRVFRIHYPAGHARDYTLHPDGRLTFAIAGQLLTTPLSFADMADMSWEGAHIEWDPEPTEPAAPVPGGLDPVQAVQGALVLAELGAA